MKTIKNKSKVLLSTVLILTMVMSLMMGCTSKPTNSEPTVNKGAEEIEPKTKTIIDSVGREVEIPTKIEKVVTVGPVGVLNCFVFTMGEGNTIANGLPPRFAKSKNWKYHSIFNPAIATNPVVEDGNAVSMETLIEINPDIVLTMDEKTADDIWNKGMNAIVLNWKNPEDVKEAVNLLGQIYNKPERAEEYSKYFDRTLAKVKDTASKISEEKRVRVLNTSLGSLSQPHVIAEWWIEEAGGISVTGGIERKQRLEFSLEQLLEWNPEVMIVSSQDDKELAYSDERFKDLEAVKNKRIYVTPSFGHVWANRTMEQPLTVLWAAKLFYPEEFKDINMNEELKLFSEKFFSYKLSDEESKEILGDMN